MKLTNVLNSAANMLEENADALYSDSSSDRCGKIYYVVALLDRVVESFNNSKKDVELDWDEEYYKDIESEAQMLIPCYGEDSVKKSRFGLGLFVLILILTGAFLLAICAIDSAKGAEPETTPAPESVEKMPVLRYYRTVYPSDKLAAAALGVPVRNFHYWNYDMKSVIWLPPAAVFFKEAADTVPELELSPENFRTAQIEKESDGKEY